MPKFGSLQLATSVCFHLLHFLNLRRITMWCKIALLTFKPAALTLRMRVKGDAPPFLDALIECVW